MRKIIFLIFIIMIITISCTNDNKPFGNKYIFDDEKFPVLPDSVGTSGEAELTVNDGFILPLNLKVAAISENEIFFSREDSISYQAGWYDIGIRRDEYSGDLYIWSLRGIYEIGNISLNAVSVISNKDATYTNIYGIEKYLYTDSCVAKENYSYGVLTKNDFYAKIYVVSIDNGRVTIEWVYQPNGSRKFY